jgi:hypothetical protein
MSCEAQAWARGQKTRNAERKAVLMALANVAGADGRVKRVRVDYLVESTDLSRRSLFARLRELETGGALTRARGLDLPAEALEVSCVLNLPGEYRPSGDPENPPGEAGAETDAGGEGASVAAEQGPGDDPEAEAASDPAEGDFGKFLRAYPFDPAWMAFGEARRLFERLSRKDRARAIRRALAYRDGCASAMRTPVDAADWLAKRRFAEAAEAASAAGKPERVFVAQGTRAWDAWVSAGWKPTLTTQNRGTGQTGWWFETLFPKGSGFATASEPVAHAQAARS